MQLPCSTRVFAPADYMASGSWCAAVDLINVLFLIPIRKEDQKQSTFTWDRQEYAFVVLSQGHVNSLAPCHSIVQRAVDHWGTLQSITLTCEIADVILTRMMSKRWLVHWRLLF